MKQKRAVECLADFVASGHDLSQTSSSKRLMSDVARCDGHVVAYARGDILAICAEAELDICAGSAVAEWLAAERLAVVSVTAGRLGGGATQVAALCVRAEALRRRGQRTRSDVRLGGWRLRGGSGRMLAGLANVAEVAGAMFLRFGMECRRVMRMLGQKNRMEGSRS